MPLIPITNNGIVYKTIYPDGSSTTTPTKHSIGEKKQIIWSIETPAYDLETAYIVIRAANYFNGVITDIVNIPNRYTISFPVGLGAGTYPIPIDCGPTSSPALNENVNMFLEIVDATNFNIIAEFYQIYDELAYNNPNNQYNHSKLLKETKISPNELTLGGSPSCFTSNTQMLSIGFTIYKPNVIVPPFTTLFTDRGSLTFGSTWPVGFYSRNAANSDPYFSSPVWDFSRSAVPVTNLSIIANTDVSFKITTPATVTKILFWIIRTDKTDNTVSMFDNYEANFEEIISTNANIGVDKLTTPVINLNLFAANVYQVGCSIAANKLSDGGKYRLIAIVYEETGTYNVNSFISQELICDHLPAYEGNGFNVLASLDDYNQQFEGNDLQCVIEERMRSKIKLYFPFNKWKNDIYTRLGLVVGNDIRRYLTNVTVTIYENTVDPTTLNVVKNIFDYKASTKIGLSSFTAQTGLTMNFSNTWAEFIYEWRNRFEANTPCISTISGGSSIMPVRANQYWGGKTLTIELVLRFTYDNYATPFSEDIVFKQQIRVKDYGEMTVKSYDAEINEYLDLEYICNDKPVCFAGILQNPSLPDRKLIVNIFPKDSSVNNVEEAEAWEGNQLTQLTTPKIINEEEDFHLVASETAAIFCVDANELSVNSQYQISAIAKKFVDTGYRITEKENPSVFEDRITEENDKRITDNL